jgi:prefoldin subunit 5
MTFDERLEFLFKSTESLHATAQETTEQIGELARTVDRLAEKIDKHSEQLAIDAENIRALARIADMHERRLTDLEGGKPT